MLTIKSQIEINASAQRVWECLMNFNNYSRWNPMIPSITGEAKVGAKLQVRLTPPEMVHSNYVLTIQNIIPNVEFRWLGHFIFPGLMDGDHVFMINQLTPNRVLLTQSESFKGFLVPFLSPLLKKNMLKGFEQMNAALKDYVESANNTLN
jgi:hypothetical protein